MPHQSQRALYLSATPRQLENPRFPFLWCHFPVGTQSYIRDDQRPFQQVELAVALHVERAERVARAAAETFAVRVAHCGVISKPRLLPVPPRVGNPEA